MSQKKQQILKITVPTTIVIFGVTGDLSQKKLLPALFDLHLRRILPAKFRIVGFSRRALDNAGFRDFVSQSLRSERHRHTPKEIAAFARHCFYRQGDFTNSADFPKLGQDLNAADRAFGTCSNKLFHLAVAPDYYKEVLQHLAKSGLTIPCVGENSGWTRVLIEKPFGRDAASAQKLDAFLASLFTEQQIFRIDHYFAKKTIQNILAFRFANSLFEPMWNRDHIERVELELYETGDVSSRINFYDGVGALRDTGQNHLLQMLAFIAMEQPADLEVGHIRSARADIMRQLVPLRRRDLEDSVVRAQYLGYLKEPGVQPRSQTETYVQLKTGLKSRRWRGVPFYLTMGKALSRDKVKIKVYFKPTKHCFGCPAGPHRHPQNFLVFRIQPQEGIAIHFWVKKPGLGMELVKKELTFDYAEFNGSVQNIPSPYETLLYSAMRGDQTNFASSEELKHSWHYITSVLKLFKDVPLQTYKKGSDGPPRRLLLSKK